MGKILALAYHRVLPGSHIDPELFEFQMKLLVKKYSPLSIEQLDAFMHGDLRLSKDAFCVTFDDGWVDNFVYVYPILRKMGIPAIIFVSTNLILKKKWVRKNVNNEGSQPTPHYEVFQQSDSDYAAADVAKTGYSTQFLTWEEIRSMEGLISIGSHGKSHAYHFCSPKIVGYWTTNPSGRENWVLLSGEKPIPGHPIYKSGSALAYPRYFPEKNVSETSGEFASRVLSEFKESATIISKETSNPPIALAWPYGEYSETSVRLAEDFGFRLGFLITPPGWIHQKDNPSLLRRFSPPRNKLLFQIAIAGELGMLLYRIILKIFSSKNKYD